MMMVTDMANQNPRIHHESFLPLSKRLRTGPAREEASISAKEKKDKIGERVSALQHLVSPFGKSDTASVLQEAAAYIKFLQDQLQVLSTPYLRTFPHGKLQEGEKSRSLRNRGLCLMPVDETVLIARSNGADIWAPISK
ncbi:transcription factor bHLH113-like isoform X2 [Phalaenopsis equestris]|nr:transcription factor bHLH113-like isoform X2 [Phalaenopsis equestris]XP_020578047.1 transcription factor bHLH113-like isoform X2 [Phalaenopsis equestris]